jgi:hypothetical protein
MRNALAFVAVFCLAMAQMSMAAPAPRSSAAPALPQEEQEQPQDQQAFEPFTADQLDNLLAPVALYPDPLLAQVLVAAGFVDQIDEASRYVRAMGQQSIDQQPWDVSVRSVAHYPSVLAMMADNLDWTTAVGQAYVYQSTDVMTSIQRLRAMANEQGNLVTNQQQQVIVEPNYIQIVPASARFIYIPYYDPAFIYFRRGYWPGYYTGVIVFGPAWPIGVWLNLDFLWPSYRVYYTGWIGGGWIARCRPHIRMSRYYVNEKFRRIHLNRHVTGRPVNYYSLSHYRSIHPRVTYQERMRRPVPRAPAVRNTNKVIDRNINIYDPNLNRFRGRTPPPQPAARPVPRPRPGQPPAKPRQPTTRPTQPPTRPPRPAKPPTTRAPTRPAPPQRQPTTRPPASRPPSAFGGSSSVFSPKAASQRGQASRSQQKARPPSSRPAPKQRPHQQRRQP